MSDSVLLYVCMMWMRLYLAANSWGGRIALYFHTAMLHVINLFTVFPTIHIICSKYDTLYCTCLALCGQMGL